MYIQDVVTRTRGRTRVAHAYVKWNLALCLANDVPPVGWMLWPGWHLAKRICTAAGQNAQKKRNKKKNRNSSEIDGNKTQRKDVFRPGAAGRWRKEQPMCISWRHAGDGNPINVANAQSAKQLRIYLTPSQAIKHFSFIHGRGDTTTFYPKWWRYFVVPFLHHIWPLCSKDFHQQDPLPLATSVRRKQKLYSIRVKWKDFLLIDLLLIIFVKC